MAEPDPHVFMRALALTMLGAAGTTLGGLVIVAYPHPTPKKLGMLQGLAAGLMLCISFMDLLPKSMAVIGFARANMFFYQGVAFFAVIVALIPEPNADALLGKGKDEEWRSLSSETPVKKHRKQVMFSGLVTALGIALHNFPEGIAVFLASMKATHTGLTLAVAIALHNIPEGIAVALPVYFATRSRWKALQLAVISGLAEPAAVIVVGGLLPVNFSEQTVECMLAAVGGIMAFLTVHELIPLAIEHSGRTVATTAIFVGMMMMSLSLHWLDGLEP
ncbi:hypothetical protein CYMTET_19034 [Cymbomonas tetramitiformis]|uniref:Zinc transporter ZupT n=1 Tax=Cymbomonas tetramitiformis TaxID=36881 RepID=A0AAE0G6X2_9CHLO|nr:hypothetical protein CYMTET_19034 [Cymbomonas tetramitiformis]